MNIESLRSNVLAHRSLLWWLTIASLGLAVLMVFTSGDVPRADEWNTPGDYLLARAKGTASFANLFRQHNESRVIFAQLLTAQLSRLWGWNQHVLHAINWALLTTTAYAFIKLFTRTLPADSSLSRPALFVVGVATALIFTPVQWRNLLSSGQIITIVIPCLLAAGLLVNHKEELPVWVRYAVAGVLSLIASFSFVNGLMLWFLLWPAPNDILRARSLRLGKPHIVASTIYFAITAVVIAAFFNDYHQPPGHPALTSGLAAPHRTVFFALTWLAGPLFPEHVHLWVGERNFLPFFLCGGLAAAAGVLACTYLVQRRTQFASWVTVLRLYPFFIFLAYSLASAASIAVARVGLGVFGNMSRYSTVAVPAYLGLAGIVAHVSLGKALPAANNVLRGFAATFGLAVVVAAATGAFSCFIDKAAAEQAKLSLGFRNLSPSDPLLTNVFPVPDYVRNMAHQLERLGIVHPSPNYTWIASTTPVQSDLEIHGELTTVNGMRVIRGAIRPPALLQPDDVLLIWDKQHSRPMTALLAPAGLNYPGKPAGAFEAKYDPAAAPDLRPENYEFRIARPSSHEVWQLRAAEGR